MVSSIALVFCTIQSTLNTWPNAVSCWTFHLQLLPFDKLEEIIFQIPSADLKDSSFMFTDVLG